MSDVPATRKTWRVLFEEERSRHQETLALLTAANAQVVELKRMHADAVALCDRFAADAHAAKEALLESAKLLRGDI